LSPSTMLLPSAALMVSPPMPPRMTLTPPRLVMLSLPPVAGVASEV